MSRPMALDLCATIDDPDDAVSRKGARIMFGNHRQVRWRHLQTGRVRAFAPRIHAIWQPAQCASNSCFPTSTFSFWANAVVPSKSMLVSMRAPNVALFIIYSLGLSRAAAGDLEPRRDSEWPPKTARKHKTYTVYDADRRDPNQSAATSRRAACLCAGATIQENSANCRSLGLA
jgi:hypothetical protein